jgi:hypothetical protein
VPLLESSLERVKAALAVIMPRTKPRKVLEEAEWEDEEGEDGSFEREIRLQGEHREDSKLF